VGQYAWGNCIYNFYGKRLLERPREDLNKACSRDVNWIAKWRRPATMINIITGKILH
jgi:hypothetical protein